MKIRKSLMAAFLFVGLVAAPFAADSLYAQDLVDANGNAVSSESAPKKKQNVLIQVVFGSGWLGTLLWLALLGDFVMAVYFIVDCFVLIKPEKIMPQALINNVQEAMGEGDVMKALNACESEPGPMANILSAGFSHVEEGFDVIQEAVNAAADLEVERITQRLTWVSVCGNLGPSLGLLGTVQGMIMTFDTLSSGQFDISNLAGSIGQALWTTAGGLCVSIPAITAFYALRNNANRLILRMTAVTMELIKGLRSVEVVGEGEEAPAEEYAAE